MIPLLRKFRERANTGHAYVPLGVNDQHYVTTVSTATNVTHQNTLPAQTTSHGSNPAVLPSVHTSLPPYAPMNIIGQNSPYPGQYSTKPPTQHSNQPCYSGNEAQPQADLLDFAAAPTAPPPQ